MINWFISIKIIVWKLWISIFTSEVKEIGGIISVSEGNAQARYSKGK